MESIETKENSIIQQIRTSGIKQSKELNIVQEILELRKERRKYVSDLSEKNNKLNEKILLLESSLKSEKDEFLKVLNEFHNDQKSLLIRREQEYITLEQALKKENELLKENSKINENKKVEKLKQMYESKLSEIEKKLQDVLNEKKNYEFSQAKTFAQSMVNKIKVELEESYNQKVAENKKSLIAIAERENNLQNEYEKTKQLLEQQKQENRKITILLNAQQDKLENWLKKEKQIEMKNCELMANEEKLLTLLKNAQNEITNLKNNHNTEISTLKDSHETTLKNIDDKIRKLLNQKDQDIFTLKNELKTLKKNYKAIEDVLKEGETPKFSKNP